MKKSRKTAILVGIALALSTVALSFPQSDRTKTEKRLKKLAGSGAVDCGTVRPRMDPKPSSDCVLKAFKNRKPFYAIYDTQEISIDSHFVDGLAGDKSGNLYDVEYSSMGWSTEGMSAETRLLDGGHIFVEPCLKPIALKKSIYKGLTCVPRIMDSAGESK